MQVFHVSHPGGVNCFMLFTCVSATPMRWNHFHELIGICTSAVWYVHVLWCCHFLLLHRCRVLRGRQSFVRRTEDRSARPVSGLSFHSCIHSFNQNRPSKFQHNPNVSIFSFMSCLKNLCLPQHSGDMLSLGSFIFPSVSAPSLVLCVVWGRGSGSPSFTSRWSKRPITSRWKDNPRHHTVMPLLYKSSEDKHVGWFGVLNSVPLVYLSTFVLSPH